MSVGDRGQATTEENVMFYGTVVGISTLLGVTAITFSIREKRNDRRMGCHQKVGAQHKLGGGVHVLCAV